MSLDFELQMSRQLLLGELLARNARKFPFKEALIDNEKRLTYRELDERVNRLANSIIACGIKKGDKVATYLKNSLKVLEISFAVAKVGAVNVPINYRLAPREIEYILRDSEAKMLFLNCEFYNNVESIKNEITEIKKYIVVGKSAGDILDNYEDFLNDGGPSMPEIWIEDDEDAFILYTSGTTGHPKGALLSHKNLIINAMTMDMEHGHMFEDTNLCVAPLFHSAAMCTIIMHMVLIATTVVHRDFNPLEVLKTIERESITYLFMVPAMWISLINLPEIKDYNTDTLRFAITGGAIMPISVKREVMSKFPNAGVIDSFGQTEMSPCTITLKAKYSLLKEGSVGLPLPNVEVCLVDNQMKIVPVGEVGEIVYRGPNMFKEYYKNPKGTEEAFKGGWFHSGDLARQDEEGFFYIVDRKKDMIISGGENIYPAEIEEVLYSHPRILEASVVGVPDHKWGESVKAFIVIKEGEKMTSEEILEFLNGLLARYKRPRYIEFIKSLPRNAAGKVLKTALRDKLIQ